MRLIRQLPGVLLGAFILAAALLGAIAPAPAQDAAESSSPAAASGSTAVPAVPVPTLGTSQPGTTVTPAEPRASEPFPWSIVIFVGTAVGLLVVLGLTARRRFTDARQPGADAPETGGPANDAGREDEAGN